MKSEKYKREIFFKNFIKGVQIYENLTALQDDI